MDRLNRLPEITDQVLGGLKADENLKHRILLSAASASPAKKKAPLRTVVALCSLSVLLILLCVFALNAKPAGDIHVIPAGSRHSAPPIHLETVIEQASELDVP